MIKRKDRLLPDLIGRLTDDYVAAKIEGIESKESSINKYKNVVLRDLIWLLNTNITINENELHAFAHVKNSVLVYGMRSLAGMNFSDANRRLIIQAIKDTIIKFERRIDPFTLNVDMIHEVDGTAGSLGNNKIKIEISGALLPMQMAEKIYLKTEIDVETGRFELVNG